MDVTSTYKHARISARKARDVAREIQGLPVSAALDLLAFTPRKAAALFQKTVKAAVADAENNFELDVEGLHIKSAVVGEGATFRRFKARARGSASSIRKRTSHITVVLSDEEKAPKVKKVTTSASKKEAGEPAPAAAKEKSTQAGAVVDESTGLGYESTPAEIDDLKELNGVGPSMVEKLHANGIYTFEQIAGWTAEDVASFDELLSSKGRIERDEWVAQARALQEKKHGK